MFIADLHIHSHYSIATSKSCDAVHFDYWAKQKGISIIGTGDFTHPAWRAQLKEQLELSGEGKYRLKPRLSLPSIVSGKCEPYFIVSGEVSCIYKRHGRTRKVHNLILLPSLEAADRLSVKLDKIGNINSDGRPILKLDSHDLLDIALSVSPEAELIPAHVWTPHFSIFGSFSGFQTMEECFGDLANHIHAVETGLSSDPSMNWRISQMDSLSLISNSDAHSPSKLGREASIFSCQPEYKALIQAIRTGNGLESTIEVFPEEGKYHMDGHRRCNVCLSPEEADRYSGICPVCGKKLTIGVAHQVESYADRPYGAVPEKSHPFVKLLPLIEVISVSTGWPVAGKKANAVHEHLLAELGPELYILRQCPISDIEIVAGAIIAEGVRRVRSGQVKISPGYDGRYGSISLMTQDERLALK